MENRLGAGAELKKYSLTNEKVVPAARRRGHGAQTEPPPQRPRPRAAE